MSKKWLTVVTFLCVVLVTDLIRRHVLPSTTEREMNLKDFGSPGDFILEQLEKRNTSRSESRSPGTEGIENKNNGILDHHTEGRKGDGQAKPRLLCWIMADPNLLDTKVIHQKQTWGKRCDKLLVMSSKQNDSFPTVGLNVPAGRNHNGLKVLAVWKYIHEYYVDDFDFFFKADADTYLVVENLLDFLKDKDPELPHYYGHIQKNVPPHNITYIAGGPGLVLTRESVRRLVTKAFVEHPNCLRDGPGEDWMICDCLTFAGCEPQDTRDAEGKETFFVIQLTPLIMGDAPKWYRVRDGPIHGTLVKDMCCSDYPISFHYVKPHEMYLVEYWLYHGKVHGKETGRIPWPKIVK